MESLGGLTQAGKSDHWMSQARFMFCSAPVVLALSLGAGCGSGIQGALYQSVDAAGRTAMDGALDNLSNQIMDMMDGAGSGDDGGGTDVGETPPPNFDGMTGEAAKGRAVFEGAGCFACHCSTAGGGCALSAPSIHGVTAETLHDRARGTGFHPGGKFVVTDQHLIDLEAFLSSLE